MWDQKSQWNYSGVTVHCAVTKHLSLYLFWLLTYMVGGVSFFGYFIHVVICECP